MVPYTREGVRKEDWFLTLFISRFLCRVISEIPHNLNPHPSTPLAPGKHNPIEVSQNSPCTLGTITNRRIIHSSNRLFINRPIRKHNPRIYHSTLTSAPLLFKATKITQNLNSPLALYAPGNATKSSLPGSSSPSPCTINCAHSG